MNIEKSRFNSEAALQSNTCRKDIPAVNESDISILDEHRNAYLIARSRKATSTPRQQRRYKDSHGTIVTVERGEHNRVTFYRDGDLPKEKGEYSTPALWLCASVDHSAGSSAFGSIPRLSSSRRSKRFIQPERLSSPSSCMAIDSLSNNSASSRNCTAKRSFLLSLVDIINHLSISFFQVDNVYQSQQKQNPVSADTPAGLLTTADSNNIEAAMKNSTTHPQGRDSHTMNKSLWRFLALSTAKPRLITIEASTEAEARQQSPDGCVMVFSARFRAGESPA